MSNFHSFLWLSSIPLYVYKVWCLLKLVSSSPCLGWVPFLSMPCSEARLSLHSLDSPLFAIKQKTGPSHLRSLSPGRLGNSIWSLSRPLCPFTSWDLDPGCFQGPPYPTSAASLSYVVGGNATVGGVPRPPFLSLFLRMSCLYRQPKLFLTLQFYFISFSETEGKHRTLLK